MGFSLEDFEDVREFRQGGTARVFTATQKSLRRKVIIKEMTCGGPDPSVQKRRFENEARATAALDHDHIIRIYDFGEYGASYYLSMEYVDGSNFEELLRLPEFPVPLALAIMLQALKGLRYSHTRGIVHRDVKPANILVSRTGQVKVADFGLAQGGGESLGLTASGMMVGTPQYMAPEQVNAERAKDPRMDIWAAGVLLYRILAGKHPFEGSTLPAIVYSIIYTKEAPLKDVLPQLPDELADCISRCLEKDPAQRPTTLDPLILAMHDYLFSLGIRDPGEEIANSPLIRDESRVENRHASEEPAREDTSNVVTTAAAEPETEVRPPIRRNAWLTIVVLILVIAAGAGLTITFLRRSAVPISSPLPQDSLPLSNTTALDTIEASIPQVPLPPASPVESRGATRSTPARANLATRDKLPLSDSVASDTEPLALAPNPPPSTSPEIKKTEPSSLPVRYGEVHVMTFPSRVEILIDGVSYGTTPLAAPIKIRSGHREVVLRKGGYREYRESIDLAPQSLKRVRARLEKENPPPP